MAGRSRIPRIAVVLPVYNCAQYIGEAIDSVLAQTFTDFELIVVDDGSTDGTFEILKALDDPRIRLLRFAENRGMPAALNLGIQQSESEYVARMDADDICHPQRFRKQVDYLDAHPTIGVCGTFTKNFGDDHSPRRPPVLPEQIRARLFFGWAMEHPSIMIRRSVLRDHALLYDEGFGHVADYDFFIRAAQVTDLTNIPIVLLQTRAQPGEVTFVRRDFGVRAEARLLLRQYRALISDATAQDEEFYLLFAQAPGPASTAHFGGVTEMFVRLDEANRKVHRYDPEIFRKELSYKWYQLHLQYRYDGISTLISYWRSQWASYDYPSLLDHLQFLFSRVYGQALVARRACLRIMRRLEEQTK